MPGFCPACNSRNFEAFHCEETSGRVRPHVWVSIYCRSISHMVECLLRDPRALAPLKHRVFAEGRKFQHSEQPTHQLFNDLASCLSIYLSIHLSIRWIEMEWLQRPVRLKSDQSSNYYGRKDCRLKLKAI